MALKDAPIVEVLQFDEADAYDHDRPISSLIRTQLLHLHHAEQLMVPAKAQTNININNLHTELEASKYIEKITALLHKHGKAKARASQSKPAKSTPKKKASSAKKAAGKSKMAAKPKATRRSHR